MIVVQVFRVSRCVLLEVSSAADLLEQILDLVYGSGWDQWQEPVYVEYPCGISCYGVGEFNPTEIDPDWIRGEVPFWWERLEWLAGWTAAKQAGPEAVLAYCRKYLEQRGSRM